MRYGVREICDVVLRAKRNGTKIGGKTFKEHEPVCYFDSLKTSSMEAAATTVYAQGGRGNARLIAWDGERTVTFTMEDALISPLGLSILSGADIIEAGDSAPIYQHMLQTLPANKYKDATKKVEGLNAKATASTASGKEYDAYVIFLEDGQSVKQCKASITAATAGEQATEAFATLDSGETAPDDYDSIMVDYYITQTTGKQINIDAKSFGGNYYLEGSTLWRDENGSDYAAEFIIPNCKVQSNFTFTMAPSGDPSTFTFTLDAFPDFTKFDHTKKVFAAIQVMNEVYDENAN